MLSEVGIHPAANIFPMMGEPEYKLLLEDIRANGVKSCLVWVGESREEALLVDGRNRLRAIQELELDPSCYSDIIHPDDMPDPVAYVLSLNLHRRHLSESQRGMVADKVATLKNGQRKSATSIDVAQSQSEAAKMLNVSVPTVQRARKVREKAVPEIIEAVERGDVTVSAAVEVAKMTPAKQREVIKEGPKAVKEVAAKQRKAKVPTKPAKQAASPKSSTEKAFTELREMFDSMDTADETAVSTFADWVMKQSDITKIHSGCSLWSEWSAARKERPSRSTK